MEESTYFSGENLSLTTPVPRDNDVVFPGENLFFYWKTSASLWESKLADCPIVGKVLVPINWAFHSDTGDQFDFAETRPETDLKKLVDIAHKLGREIVFLLPLSPAPFLTNGGVPHLLSRSLASGPNGMAHAFLDSEKKLTKIFSFYDPRVFQGYAKFVKALGRYFSEKGIGEDVYGINCGTMVEGQFQSFFNDTSKAFEQAFGRFIQAKREEKLKDDPNDDTPLISNAQDEALLKSEFRNTIRDLYKASAESSLSGNWEGTVEFSFLSSSNEDFFNRLSDHYDRKAYTRDVFSSLSRDIIPSSVLIPAKNKGHVLKTVLDDLVSQSQIPLKFTDVFYDEENSSFFRPLSFMEVYENDFHIENVWRNNGLVDFIEEDFYHAHQYKKMDTFKWDESIAMTDTIRLIDGGSLSKERFHAMLKFFMNGGRVILDTRGLSDELQRRLESFYLENSLQLEKLNYHTRVQNISLGEGRLVLIDGAPLVSLSKDKASSFWDKVFSTFETRHLKVDLPDGVDLSWRRRSTSASELSYEEVRRLGVYNESSYKKKVIFSLPKNFALIKVLDQMNVTVETHNNTVTVEMLPGASVNFDFGIYS